MHQPYDHTLKFLLDTYPQDLLGHLLGLPVAGPVQFLQTELPADVRWADALLEVPLLHEPPALIHLEVQTRYDAEVPLRMLDYAVRIVRKYGRPVRSWLLVLLPPTSSQEPVRDSYGWGDLEQGHGLTFRYHVIRVWDLNPALGFEHPGLLPLVPLMRGTETTLTLLDQCAARIAEWDPPLPERQNLLWSIGNLASLRYNEGIIRDWLRRIGMIETPLMQALREEGKSEGRLEGQVEGRLEGQVEGRLEGQVEGRVEGEIRALLTILTLRGLPISDAQRSRIQQCRDLAQLEEWLKRSLAAQSADELLA